MKKIASKNLLLLEILALLSPDSSKNTLRSWVEKGRVAVDGKMVRKPNLLVLQGQEVSLGKRTQFIEEGIEILYEDNHVVVIQKPEGLLSVATAFDKRHTAHAILKRKYHSQRVYPVHRLDRETSGLMVFAYTELAKESLKEQFHSHSIGREYCAIVEGHLDSSSGTWQSYLREQEDYVVTTTSAPEKGKLAITHYKVLGQKQGCTLLNLTLETGRKNQIRVHCKEAGHPIVGDIKYGATRHLFGRLCLHARSLSFIHPFSNKLVSFESPLPETFSSLRG